MKGILAILGMLALVAGCQATNKNADKTAALSPSVTDISTTPPAVAEMPAVQQPIQPVSYDAPAAAPAAPAAAPAAAGAGGQYTVKKGDTLWRIAASHYGNGNQWQRIASANPGLSPSTLKVGQTIVIP